MEIKNIKKIERRNKIISIRTYKAYSEWMKENNISPSKVFNEAVKELMEEKK